MKQIDIDYSLNRWLDNVYVQYSEQYGDIHKDIWGNLSEEMISLPKKQQRI